MSEEKSRIHTRITPETEEKIQAAMVKANCQSRNEFLEKALLFYCDYLASEDLTEFLPPIFVQAMQGAIQCSENRISRLLFKLAVEQDMMMNVLAAGLEINTEALDDLRGRCVQNVKQTSGAITFKDAVKYQNRED